VLPVLDNPANINKASVLTPAMTVRLRTAACGATAHSQPGRGRHRPPCGTGGGTWRCWRLACRGRAAP
jgi:hypothetical protein